MLNPYFTFIASGLFGKVDFNESFLSEKSAYELEIKKLKENQIVVSQLTEKMHLADKELKSAKEEVQILSSKMRELERRM